MVKKAFTLEDKPFLMSEKVSIIAELSAKMFGETVSVEEQEKKLKSDLLRFNLLALADRLHKTVDEVEHLTLSDINEWYAYFKVLENGRPKS